MNTMDIQEGNEQKEVQNITKQHFLKSFPMCFLKLLSLLRKSFYSSIMFLFCYFGDQSVLTLDRKK